jgi:hypothetical protein
LNLKQSSHYKEGPPQYVTVHQIVLSGRPVVHKGKKVKCQTLAFLRTHSHHVLYGIFLGEDILLHSQYKIRYIELFPFSIQNLKTQLFSILF